jgi:hypothetical protein
MSFSWQNQGNPVSIKAIIRAFGGIQSQNWLLVFLLSVSTFSHVQAAPAPDATCIASALNRNVAMNGEYYVIPGVPRALGKYRVRAICSDGTQGETGLVDPALTPWGSVAIKAGPIVWGQVTPVPQSLTMDAPANMSYGQTVQLSTKAVALDTSVSDVTLGSQGTNYRVSNPWSASVSKDGLLTVLPYAYAKQVVVSATNEGTPMARLINIGPRAPINGKVVMADGVTAAAGVQVSLQLNAPLTRLPALTTDASGNFTQANAAAGDYTVTVVDPVTGNRGSRMSTLAANGQGVFDVKLVGQGNINVTVLGSGDQPVSGAQIVLSNGQFSGVVKAIQTDVNGVATASRFLAGNFNLSVSDAATGGIATASGNLAADGVVNLTVKLQPVGIISGMVLAADGVTPQAGMQVRLLSASKGIVSSAISAVDGRFRFDSLPLADGPYTLLAVASGSIQGSVGGLMLTYANQELQQNVLLGTFASGGVVSGIVTNENNAPQANFTVVLTAFNGQQLTSQTDAQGNYKIYGVPQGYFTVTSGVTGYQGSASGTVHTDGEQITANMTVQPYGQVTGTVLLSTGQPAANANIVFHSGMNSVRQLTADGSGNFVVDHAPVGFYSIDANDPVTGERGLVNGMLTSPNEEQQRQLTLTAVSNLRVRVTDAGSPVANARVNLALQGLIPYGAELYTDANGIVEFTAVPKSAYSLAVLSTANGTKSGRTVGVLRQAIESATVAIIADNLVPYTVYGQVLDTKAMPVANQWVRLSSRKNYLGLIPPTPISNWDEYFVKTDASGNFTFQNVLVHDGGKGALLLDALVYGQLAGRVVMTTPASGQAVNQDIALFTAGKVLGFVKNATSKPVVGIPIALSHQFNGLYAADDFIKQTDEQGRYALQFVPLGGFTVAVLDGIGGTLASSQASLQQEGQVVTLNFNSVETGAITGLVQFEAGRGVPSQLVQLFDINGVLYAQTYTDKNGVYYFSKVVTGSYTIKLQNGIFTFAESLLEVTGQTLVKNVVVPAPLLIKVKRSNGMPIAGATVYGYYNGSYQMNLGQTNAEGKLDVDASNCPYYSKYSASYPGNANVTVTTTTPPPACKQSQIMEIQFQPMADAQVMVTQNGNAPMAGAQILNGATLLGSTNASGIFNITLGEGAYSLTVKTSEGLTQNISFVVDTVSDGTIISRTVDFTTQFEKFGKLSFVGERHLYSIAVKQGDKLAIMVHGAAVDGMNASYLVNADIYSPDKTLKASGYGYGSAFNYVQYNTSGDLLNTTIDADGNYVVAIKPYYTDYLGGYFLSASVNEQPVEIKPYQGGGSVQGTVYQVDGTTPLPNATVDISVQDVLGLHIRATTDASGHYQFDNVPLAGLTVSLIEAEQVLVSAANKLDVPAQVIVQDLKMPQKTTLQVSITVPTGTAIPNSMNFSVTGTNGTRNVGPVLFGGNNTSTTFTTVGVGDTITLSASHPNNANITATQTVNGADGQTVAVNLLLESGNVSGTIFNGDGTPSTNATVYAYRASNHTYIDSTMTDSQGMYLLTTLPVGQDLLISVFNPGNFLSGLLSTSITVNLGSGQDLAGQDIHLIATGSVTGFVKVSTGAAVPNTSVVIDGVVNGSSFSMPGMTDQNGQFRIDNVPIGVTLQVSATGPGASGVQQQSAVISSVNQLLTLPDFTFVQGSTLQVNVLDGDYQERPNIFFDMWSECGWNQLVVTTSLGDTVIDANDPAGFAPLQGMPAGPAVVKFYGNNCGPVQLLASATINIEPNRSQTLDLLVPLVIAKVSLEGGFPARNPSARLTQVNPDGSTTDFWPVGGSYGWNNGFAPNAFVFAGVQPGDFSIYASDYYSSSNSLATVYGTMVGNANTNIDVVLPYTYSGSGSIVGSVKFSDGTPAPNMNVMLFQSQVGYTTYATTDASGLYVFDWPVAGAFDITAQDPNTGWSASASGNMVAGVANRIDLVMPPAGTVTGTLYDSNYNPIPYADVYVNSSGLPGVDLYTTTDAQGVYRFAQVALGTITVTGYDPVAQLGLIGTGTLSADRQTLTLNLNDAAGGYTGAGMISGIVTFSDGAPVGGAGVNLGQSGQGLYTTTDGSGYYQFISPAIGAFDITVLDGTSGLSVKANGAVVASVINTTNLVMPASGSVIGTLYDSSSNPIPNVKITVSSSGVPGFTLMTTTDAQGQYRIDHVALGAITATEPNRQLSGTGTLSADQQTITVDLQATYTGPGMISGTVRFYDGTPVINADVDFTQNGQTIWVASDNVGGYQFPSPIIGPYEITAYDINSSLSATAIGTVMAGVVNTVDLVMPAAGSVTGTLYDINNQPISNADVYVNTSGMPGYDLYGMTDAQGVYRVDQVGVGAITVMGFDPTTQLVASATGTLSTNLQAITVDIHETAGGIVTGHVWADASGTPMPYANVTLVTNRSYGPFWPLSQSVAADASGIFNFTSAPSGGFRLYAVDPANPAVVGFGDGTAIANTTANVDVTLGNGTGFPFVLTGSDGYVYSVACDGTLNNGAPPYYWSYGLMIDNRYIPCSPGAGLSFDKRELSFGPAMMEKVQVTRKVYSPAAGGFVRFIDTYTNPGNVDVTIGVDVGGNTGYYAPLLVDPAGNNQTYAVLDSPAVATVFGGAGGVLNPAGTFSYQAYAWTDAFGVQNYYSALTTYHWTLTVPAGKSVSLMLYSAQAASGLVAQAIANTLSTNAATSMFDGIAPVDKASIFNFAVP